MRIINVEKGLVNKLADECDENIDEVKILHKNEDKCNSCTLHCFQCCFTINVKIATYFV